MNYYHYSLFLIFSIIAVMIVIDQNVGEYIILLTKILKIKVERLYWMTINHPRNPIVNWIKMREYEKIARQLQDEFSKRNES